jgi:hypothetical protein
LPYSKIVAPTNNNNASKRGFQKLQEVGFSPEEIDNIKNNYYSKYPENAKLPDEARYLAEEKFIDSDNAIIDVCTIALLFA